MSKYAPLAGYLKRQSGREPVTMAFSDIEGVIDASLPPSAFTYRAWWANNAAHVQARAWLDAGWRVEVVSLVEQRVTFVRQ